MNKSNSEQRERHGTDTDGHTEYMKWGGGEVWDTGWLLFFFLVCVSGVRVCVCGLEKERTEEYGIQTNTYVRIVCGMVGHTGCVEQTRKHVRTMHVRSNHSEVEDGDWSACTR